MAMLQMVYKQFIKVAMLMHLIRASHHEAEHLFTDADARISEFLDASEHSAKAGIYPIICKIKTVLAFHDALPKTNGINYGMNLMQGYLKGSPSKAERQNRQFIVISNILRTIKVHLSHLMGLHSIVQAPKIGRLDNVLLRRSDSIQPDRTWFH